MCNECPLKYDVYTLQNMARDYRRKRENWLVKLIRDIKYKIWFNKNWK